MANFLDEVRESSWIEVFAKKGKFLVPIFQRPYTWTEEQVNRYIETVEEILKDPNKQEKFIGNIVLKDNEGNFDIIDGQQRFTTTSLIIRAILEIIKEQLAINKTLEDEENNDTSILEELEYVIKSGNYLKYATGSKELRLKPLHFQEKDWNTIIDNFQNSNDDEFDDTNYKKNFDIIYKKLIELITNDDNSLCYKKLNNIFDIVINKLKIIYVFLARDKDEFEIFETLNSLGQPLGVADLVKNKLLQSEKPSHNPIYIKYWQPIFEEGKNKSFWDTKRPESKNDETNIEVFFKYYMQSIAKDVPSNNKNNGLYLAYVNYFNKCSSNKLTIKDIAEDLKHYATSYVNLLDDGSSFLKKHPKTKELITFLKNLGASIFYPVIMYYTRNLKETTEIENISSLILSCIVRRLCCKLDNREMPKFILSNLKKAKKVNESLYLFLKSEIDDNQDLSSKYPTDSEILSQLPIKNLTEATVRSILKLLETRIRSKTLTDVNEKIDDKLTLEHIVPSKYEKWTEIESKTPKQQRDNATLIKTIGNLTLLSGKRNTKASNEHWSIKKEFYTSSNLELNKQLLKNYPDFNGDWKKSIKDRSTAIAKLIKDNFKY